MSVASHKRLSIHRQSIGKRVMPLASHKHLSISYKPIGKRMMYPQHSTDTSPAQIQNDLFAPPGIPQASAQSLQEAPNETRPLHAAAYHVIYKSELP